MRRRAQNKSSSFDGGNYMTIEPLEECTISFTHDVKYTKDGELWRNLKALLELTLSKGKLYYFKSTIEKSWRCRVNITGKFNLRGNCMSLIFGDNAKGKYDLSEYIYVFQNSFTGSNVVEVEKTFLPATILSHGCYNSMFSGCTSLTTAPELPATTLVENCYSDMFSSCTSLVNAPELPATALANYCYRDMFRGCTSLTTAPSILSATTLAENCYYSMFQDCTNLITAPELPATTLAKYCYYSMFQNCTSLTTAPELPATSLVDDYCYYCMFRGCTKLNYIKMLATDIPFGSCLSGWVENVASAGTFVKNPEATWDKVGVSGVPSGWTVKFDGEEDDSIETTLQFPLYIYFDECESLWVNTTCYADGDFSELKRYLIECAERYGTKVDDYRYMDEEAISQIGEIYIEDERLNTLVYYYGMDEINYSTATYIGFISATLIDGNK